MFQIYMEEFTKEIELKIKSMLPDKISFVLDGKTTVGAYNDITICGIWNLLGTVSCLEWGCTGCRWTNQIRPVWVGDFSKWGGNLRGVDKKQLFNEPRSFKKDWNTPDRVCKSPHQLAIKSILLEHEESIAVVRRLMKTFRSPLLPGKLQCSTPLKQKDRQCDKVEINIRNVKSLLSD